MALVRIKTPLEVNQLEMFTAIRRSAKDATFYFTLSGYYVQVGGHYLAFFWVLNAEFISSVFDKKKYEQGGTHMVQQRASTCVLLPAGEKLLCCNDILQFWRHKTSKYPKRMQK